MVSYFGKRWKKLNGGARAMSGVLVILILVGILYVYRDWREARDFVPQDFNTFMEVERSEREIGRYTELMEKAYREDMYGGATPEETLKLFTEALKAGDTELAAKYFVVEKQREMEDTLNHWKSINKLATFVSAIADYGKTDYVLLHSAQIPVLKSGRASMIMYFNLNDQTKKWKIESL